MASGFRVIRIWEHDLNAPARCVEQIIIALEEYPSYLTAAGIDAIELKAVARARRAGVNAPVSAVLSWVRAVGPESLLSAKLSEIVAVANAF